MVLYPDGDRLFVTFIGTDASENGKQKKAVDHPEDLLEVWKTFWIRHVADDGGS